MTEDSHNHQRLPKNILSKVIFIKIEKVYSGEAKLIEGILKATNSLNEILYFYVSDNFALYTEYNNLTVFYFNIPFEFINSEKIETLRFISRYDTDIVMKIHGRLCSSRIAAFFEEKIAHFIINNEYYIPIEGTYDFEEPCNGNHGGLDEHEIHGYFIILTQIDFNSFIQKYKFSTTLGTNICPGLRNNSGLFKYGLLDFDFK